MKESEFVSALIELMDAKHTLLMAEAKYYGAYVRAAGICSVSLVPDDCGDAVVFDMLQHIFHKLSNM